MARSSSLSGASTSRADSAAQERPASGARTPLSVAVPSMGNGGSGAMTPLGGAGRTPPSGVKPVGYREDSADRAPLLPKVRDVAPCMCQSCVTLVYRRALPIECLAVCGPRT